MIIIYTFLHFYNSRALAVLTYQPDQNWNSEGYFNIEMGKEESQQSETGKCKKVINILMLKFIWK